MDEPRRPVPRPPRDADAERGAAYGEDAADAGGSEDRPSVVADVEASLGALVDLAPEEQVQAYRDLEALLRDSLRSAGEDA